MSDSPDQSSSEAHPQASVRLADIFAPNRIQIGVEVSSLKRMIEEIAGVFAQSNPHQLDKDAVFRALLEREQIGSTWVTDGVAIPHCRLDSITDAVGVVLRTSSPLCVDANENKFVSVACGLLVPMSRSDEHIQVLSRLARAFMKFDLYPRLMAADNSAEIHDEILKIETEFDRNEN